MYVYIRENANDWYHDDERAEEKISYRDARMPLNLRCTRRVPEDPLLSPRLA